MRVIERKTFAAGDTVRLGDPRWFEFDYKTCRHEGKGLLSAGDVVIVLSVTRRIGSDTFGAFVLDVATIGYVYLDCWRDEVLNGP